MKTTKEFKLINGQFNAADAGAIIRNFYNEKVRYHNRQLLYMMESKQGDQKTVESKIAELEANSIDIADYLENNTHGLVEVHGSIAITINR